MKIDEKEILTIYRGKSNTIDISIWINYRILIYSPSVSAGVSFELRHFHVLIGLFSNSMGYTPNVDLCL